MGRELSTVGCYWRFFIQHLFLLRRRKLQFAFRSRGVNSTGQLEPREVSSHELNKFRSSSSFIYGIEVMYYSWFSYSLSTISLAPWKFSESIGGLMFPSSVTRILVNTRPSTASRACFHDARGIDGLY